MTKIFLDEMTWRQAEKFMKESDAAIVPVGTIEVHGPHLPLGTDTYIAWAMSILAARKTKAVVLPPVFYSYVGATRYFDGTIGISIDTQIRLLKDICRSLIERGFKRIFLVSFHFPNYMPLSCVAREIFEERRVPVVYFHISSNEMREEFLNSKEVKAFRDASEKDPGFSETSLVLASLEVLGKKGIYDDTIKNPPRVSGAEDIIAEISKHGAKEIGYHYTDESQHIPVPSKPSAELAMGYLEKASDEMAKAIDKLKDYLKYLDKQKVRQ